MTAFPARDWGGFVAHAARIRADPTVTLRVLQKCGFSIVDEDRWPSTVGGEDVEDWVLRLDAIPADG
jgi:hypothetical protein